MPITLIIVYFVACAVDWQRLMVCTDTVAVCIMISKKSALKHFIR
ncbi:hypothetical protein N878_26920 [Pseudomonas sp. EGD-AK9]|nr:hypothetical protein N878_26920 [Pseudomonas sp. EGD-AK9]